MLTTLVLQEQLETQRAAQAEREEGLRRLGAKLRAGLQLTDSDRARLHTARYVLHIHILYAISGTLSVERYWDPICTNKYTYGYCNYVHVIILYGRDIIIIPNTSCGYYWLLG